MNDKLPKWAAVGALIVGLSVVLGAFGAHALRDRLDPMLLSVYEKAVYYQLVHGLGLLFVACLSKSGMLDQDSARRVNGLIFFGVVVFCGSLYLYVATGMRQFGAITPIGGVSFIGAWFLLSWNLFRQHER